MESSHCWQVMATVIDSQNTDMAVWIIFFKFFIIIITVNFCAIFHIYRDAYFIYFKYISGCQSSQ